jgi:hypothetical protein
MAKTNSGKQVPTATIAPTMKKGKPSEDWQNSGED